MASTTWRSARRPMAAMLIAALGWPSVAGATSRAPEPEAPATTVPETETEQPAEPTPAPKVELTPEEIERRRLELLLEQAMLHYQEGKRLYYGKRYAEAAEEFERSYAAAPAADTLYSMALAYGRAGKPVEAVRALRQYLALPDCEGRPPEERTTECPTQRAGAQEELEEQRLRVGELELSLGEGVRLREVRVDGRVVPLEDFPLLLLPGTVDVEVFGLGPNERRTRPAYITGGEVTTFYVAPFEPEVVVRPEPDVPVIDPIDERRQQQRQRALRSTFWVGTGLTGLSAVALATTGGLTLYHTQRFDAEKCPPECWEKNPDGTPKRDEDGNIEYLDRPYPANHEREFERYRPITNVLVGVTVGLAVATALVGTFAFRKRARERTGEGEKGVRARVRMGASGLVVRW